MIHTDVVPVGVSRSSSEPPRPAPPAPGTSGLKAEVVEANKRQNSPAKKGEAAGSIQDTLSQRKFSIKACKLPYSAHAYVSLVLQSSALVAALHLPPKRVCCVCIVLCVSLAPRCCASLFWWPLSFAGRIAPARQPQHLAFELYTKHQPIPAHNHRATSTTQAFVDA